MGRDKLPSSPTPSPPSTRRLLPLSSRSARCGLPSPPSNLISPPPWQEPLTWRRKDLRLIPKCWSFGENALQAAFLRHLQTDEGKEVKSTFSTSTVKDALSGIMDTTLRPSRIYCHL